jgi:hypothetical protein
MHLTLKRICNLLVTAGRLRVAVEILVTRQFRFMDTSFLNQVLFLAFQIYDIIRCERLSRIFDGSELVSR